VLDLCRCCGASAGRRSQAEQNRICEGRHLAGLGLCLPDIHGVFFRSPPSNFLLPVIHKARIPNTAGLFRLPNLPNRLKKRQHIFKQTLVVVQRALSKVRLRSHTFTFTSNSSSSSSSSNPRTSSTSHALCLCIRLPTKNLQSRRRPSCSIFAYRETLVAVIPAPTVDIRPLTTPK